MKVNELKLLAGLPIEVEGVGKVHPLTLKEIAEIGEIKYNQYISSLCFEMEDLDFLDNVKDKEKITPFDVIVANCINDKKFEDVVKNSFGMFFNSNANFVEEYGLFFIEEIEEQKFIHRDNFEIIKSIIRDQNCIQKPKLEEYNPANEAARKLIEKIKQNKANKPKTKSEINLHSIISSVAWKSHIGIKSIWDLTVYQLYDAYHRLSVVDNYDKTMQGIYYGTVQLNKNEMKKINWSQIIELN